MRFFENEDVAKKVVELLIENGYEYARYVSGGIYEDLTLGSSPNRYVNLGFDKQRGFHMSTTGTWVEGEGMKLVEKEARKVNELHGKIMGILSEKK